MNYKTMPFPGLNAPHGTPKADSILKFNDVGRLKFLVVVRPADSLQPDLEYKLGVTDPKGNFCVLHAGTSEFIEEPYTNIKGRTAHYLQLNKNTLKLTSKDYRLYIRNGDQVKSYSLVVPETFF